MCYKPQCVRMIPNHCFPRHFFIQLVAYYMCNSVTFLRVFELLLRAGLQFLAGAIWGNPKDVCGVICCSFTDRFAISIHLFHGESKGIRNPEFSPSFLQLFVC